MGAPLRGPPPENRRPNLRAMVAGAGSAHHGAAAGAIPWQQVLLQKPRSLPREIALNILTRFIAAQPLPGWLKPRRWPAAQAAPTRRAPLPTLLEEQVLPQSCGWFDSSHELHSGLLVVEHSPVDRLALGRLLATAAPVAMGRGSSPRAGPRRGWRCHRRHEIAPGPQAAEGVDVSLDSVVRGP